MLIQAASNSPNWRPEMKDWYVVGFRHRYMPVGHTCNTVDMELVGFFGGHEEWAELEFEYVGRFPDMKLKDTLDSMDKRLCPEGLLYVWSEEIV
jgi:hypothetical protein